MAWRYCQCGAELDEPTIEEQIQDNLPCVECNGYTDGLVSSEELMLNLLALVRSLEERINILEQLLVIN